MFNTHPKVGSDFLKNIPRLEEVAEAITYQINRYEEINSVLS